MDDVIQDRLEEERHREEKINRDSEILQASFDSLIDNGAFQTVMVEILNESTLLRKSISNEDEGKKDIGRMLCQKLILSSEESFDMIMKKLTQRSFSRDDRRSE